MPVTNELLTQISGYEKQGYSSDDILKGIEQSPKYPDVAKKIGGYRKGNYNPDDILKGIKSTNPTVPKVTESEVPEWVTKHSWGPTLYGVLGATKETLKFATKNAAEISALVGGGIVGTAAEGGVPGPLTVAGAGLAYGAVKTAERGLEGEKPTIAQGLKTAAEDVVMGSFFETFGQVVPKVIQKVVAPIRKTLVDHVTGALNKETETYLKTVKETGYTPTAAEITGMRSKGVGMVEGMLSYLPGSTGLIQRARMANLEKLVSLRGDLLAKGGNESTIENVGFRLKQKAEELIKSTVSKRANISAEQSNALVSKFMADVNATSTTSTRDFGLSKALSDFYDGVGSATTLSSVGGKTVQDYLGQAKLRMEKEAGEKLSSAEKTLGGQEVSLNESQKIADQLIREELKSSYPDPKVIRMLRPYASADIETQSLDKTITLGKGKEGVDVTRAQNIGDYLKSPEMQKRNPELYNAWISELSQTKKTWTGLNLDREKLGALARQENKLDNTQAGRKYILLRSGIEKDMGTHAQGVNPEAHKTFMEGKQEWFQKEQLFDNDTLKIMHQNPEDVFKTVVNPGEVENIRKLKAILGDKDFQPMKEIFTRKIIATDKNGVLDVAKTKQNINKYGETFKEVFNKDEQKQFQTMIDKATQVEDGYAKSKSMKDVFALDSNGNIRVDATKKNILKNKEQLSKQYTDDELNKLDSVISTLQNTNIKMLARNKSEAMNFLGTIASGNRAPENIVNAIVKPNNTINIRYMKRLLGPEMSKEVENKFVENYLMEMNQFGYYLPEKSARVFNQYDKTMRQLMDEPTYREVSNLMRLNRNTAMLDRIAQNPSQTGQTLIGFETGKEVLKSVTYGLVAGIGGYEASKKGHTGAGITFALALAFGPRGLAKLYLSPTGRKLLSVGYTIPATSQEGIALATKMATIAGVNILKDKEEQPQEQDSNPERTKEWGNE